MFGQKKQDKVLNAQKKQTCRAVVGFLGKESEMKC